MPRSQRNNAPEILGRSSHHSSTRREPPCATPHTAVAPLSILPPSRRYESPAPRTEPRPRLHNSQIKPATEYLDEESSYLGSTHSRYQSYASGETFYPPLAVPRSRAMTNSQHNQNYAYPPHSSIPSHYEDEPSQAQSYAYPHHYHYPPNQRPLIDLVTNEWATNPKYIDHFSDYSDDDYGYQASDPEKDDWPEWAQNLARIRVPRRVQRWLLIYFLFLIFCWFGWLYWLQPAWQEEKVLDESLVSATMKGNTFGSNIRPAFTDMVHVRTLDARLIPGVTQEKRRLVFVGDVHGCKDERMATHHCFVVSANRYKS
jgi:hypothetical protein